MILGSIGDLKSGLTSQERLDETVNLNHLSPSTLASPKGGQRPKIETNPVYSVQGSKDKQKPAQRA